MILAHRNNAFKRLGLSFGLLVCIVLLVGTQALGVPKVLIAVGAVILATFSVVLYIQGNIVLARAKGYDDSAVAAIIIVSGLCLMGLFYAMPLIIFFGLKDRTKSRWHSRGPGAIRARPNPPAEIPPIQR